MMDLQLSNLKLNKRREKKHSKPKAQLKSSILSRDDDERNSLSYYCVLIIVLDPHMYVTIALKSVLLVG